MKFETKFSEYFKLPNPGLRSYFANVEVGNDQEYRTPFYGKQTSVTEVLKGWDSTLETIQKKFPTLYEYELDLRKKVGPMSIMFPLSERMKDIDSYYDSILLESKPISPEAIALTLDEWSDIRGIRLRSQRRTVELMKKSTNSGSPFFTKRRTVVDETYPCTFTADGDDYWQHLSSGDWKAAAVLGWRGQEGGPKKTDVKQRVVWMFPFAVNICELQFYQPFIEAMQHSTKVHVPAWVGMDAVDRAITRMFDTKDPKDLVICTDFTKFDQHFNSSMQDAALSIIKGIDTDDVLARSWREFVFPIKYNIPLAYDYGKIRFGKHGMGSGSGGTNADETMVHRALQHEAAHLSGAKLNPYSQCLGDDGVLTFPGITVDKVMQAYTSHGQEMNESKQYASTHDCTYLRRWHSMGYRVNGICVGVYSTYRALGRLCEQERWYDPDKWSNKMVALRQLSILENCKYHPLREEFVDYCIKGDKYRLGMDIPGFLDNIGRYAREAIEEMPDFMGYTRSLQSDGNPDLSGIADWWIVKTLKSRR